jgi:hypothetical protein
LPLGQYILLEDKPISEFEKKPIIHQLVKDVKILKYLVTTPIITTQYDLIWTSDYNNDNKIFSVWRPICPIGTISIGDIIVSGIDKPNIITPCIPTTMLEPFPISNGIIWHSVNDSGKSCYCWGSGNIGGYTCSNIYGSNQSNFPELGNVFNIPLQFLNNNTIKSTGDILANGVEI